MIYKGVIMRILRAFLLLVFLNIFFILNFASASKIHEETGIMPSHSAEYVRTLNRNASTDADAAFYNPAGLVFLPKNGLYTMFSNQTVFAHRGCDNNLGQMAETTYGGMLDPTYLNLPYAPNVTQESTYAGKQYNKYNLDIIVPAVPDLNIIYKSDNWAAYFNLAVLQGVSQGMMQGVEFKDGAPALDNGFIAIYNGNKRILGILGPLAANIPNTFLTDYTRDESITRNELYLGLTAGGACKILDWISASLGLRFIHASLSNKFEASNINFKPVGTPWPIGDWDIDINPFKNGIDIKTESTGNGFGIIAGTDVKPINDLNIGVRLEYYTPLILKNKTKRFIVPGELDSSGELDILKDGVKTAATFPPSASLGISYKILSNLKIDGSLDWYFRRWVDYGPEVSDDTLLFDVDNLNAKHRMRKDHWNYKSFRAGGALEYEIIKGLKASAGYSYNNTGFKNKYRRFGSELLNSHTFGAGASYAITDNLDLTLAGMYIMYVSAEVNYIDANTAIGSFDGRYVTSYSQVNQKFSERRIVVALGLTYRMDMGSSSAQPAEEPKVSSL